MQSGRFISPTEPPTHTPWGVADYVREHAPGIAFYATPSHGGFRLSAERLEEMHPALRRSDRWFEEDCDWAKVAFCFPKYFSEAGRLQAIQTLKDWSPDLYEAATGQTLAPGSSYKRDQHLFYERHVRDWVVISALNSDRYPGMVECIATLGGQRGAMGQPDPAERRYLVPVAEYDQRSRFGFVINPGCHARCDGPSSGYES